MPNQRLRSTPGKAALYSNVTFDFLSDALQSAAHMQYAALLYERTLKPHHMQQTTFFPNAEQCRHLLISAHKDGPCSIIEATAGGSGLYSTATDMAIWLKYLLRIGDPGISAQDASAQAVFILPSNLVSQKRLDHAGEPTGIGQGWIHILPVDSPSHIIEKTGGGAGFETYIAINHSRRTAIFLAATDGPVDTHLNLFNAANKLLLAIAGLPPLPPPPPNPPPNARTLITVAKRHGCAGYAVPRAARRRGHHSRMRERKNQELFVDALSSKQLIAVSAGFRHGTKRRPGERV